MTTKFGSGSRSFDGGHFLLLRMHVRNLAVSVRILAMIVSRGSVLLRLFVVAVIVVMGCLAMVMGRRLMLRSRMVMMLAGDVPLFLCHVEFLLITKIRDVSGQSARLTSVTNFTDSGEVRWLGPSHATASEKKAGVAEHPEVFDHAGILVNGPPGTAGLPFS